LVKRSHRRSQREMGTYCFYICGRVQDPIAKVEELINGGRNLWERLTPWALLVIMGPGYPSRPVGGQRGKKIMDRRTGARKNFTERITSTFIYDWIRREWRYKYLKPILPPDFRGLTFTASSPWDSERNFAN